MSRPRARRCRDLRENNSTRVNYESARTSSVTKTAHPSAYHWRDRVSIELSRPMPTPHWRAVVLVSSRSRRFRRRRGGGAGVARRGCRVDRRPVPRTVSGGQRRADPVRSAAACSQARRAEDLTAPSSEDVNPAAAVSVAAFSGTLDDVTMVNDAGKPIPGVLTRDKRGWHPTSHSVMGAPTR